MTREEAIEVLKKKVEYLESDKRFKAAVEILIPELRESEDERIRKWLVDYFKAVGKSWIHRDISPEQIIDWLEKQKESLHIHETCKENADSFTDSVIEVRSFQRGLEEGRRQKQKEQKPADFPTTDEEMKEFLDKTPPVEVPEKYKTADWLFDKMCQKPAEVCYGPKGDPGPAGIQTDMVEIGRLIFRYFRKVIASFGVYAENEKLLESKLETLCYYSQQCTEEILHSLRPQPKVEWSEEDSDNLEMVHDYLWMLDDYIGDDCAISQKETDNIRRNIQGILSPWIKSLPERFNLQPKQEWSEEDEEMLEYIIGDVNDAQQLYTTTKEAKDMAAQEIDWLKSLPMRCPKSSDNWKPSEEQMEELQGAITFMAIHNMKVDSLVSLHKELKKL